MISDFLRNRLLLAFLLFLSGCAETKYVMHLDPDYRAASVARIWPAAPETPRYRYVGQLLGEENFVSDDANNRNAGIKLFHWLVGLVGMGEEKIMLKRPQSGVSDANGRTYVTDISNHAVFVFDQAAGELLVWNQALEHKKFVTPIGLRADRG